MSQKVFSYNSDISKNAYMNWRVDCNLLDPGAKDWNFSILASSYSDASLALCQIALDNNRDKKADSLVFPILYCADQAIELYIKAIIRIVDDLQAGNQTVSATHDLRQLKSEIVSRIRKKEGGKTKGLDKHLKSLTDYIDELYGIIGQTGNKKNAQSKMDFARYPVSTDGVPHFYISTKENVVVDLEAFKYQLTEAFESLESLYDMYSAEREAIRWG